MNKFLHLCVAFVWWMSLLLTLISTLLLVVVKLSLEYLAEDHSRLTGYIHSLTSQPIEITETELDWEGPVPIIRIGSLGYQNDAISLELNSVLLKPLIIQSVLEQQVLIELAKIESGTITVHLDKFASNEKFDLDELIKELSTVVAAGNYSVSNLSIDLIDGNKQQTFKLASARSVVDDGGWQLAINAIVPSFAKVDIYHNHLGKLSEKKVDFNGQVYARIDLSEDSSIAKETEAIISLPEELTLSAGIVEMWLGFESGEPSTVLASIEQLDLKYNAYQLSGIDSSLIITRSGQSGSAQLRSLDQMLAGWQLLIPTIDFYHQGKAYQYDTLQMSVDASRNVGFSIDQINTKPIFPLFSELLSESSSDVELWRVHTVANDVEGSINIDDLSTLELKAIIEDFSLGSNSNEILQLSMDRAEIILENEQLAIDLAQTKQVNLTIDGAYEQALVFDSPHGNLRLDWQTPYQLQINFDNLFVRNQGVPILADFSYTIDFNELALSNMMMHLVFEGLSIADKDRLIPYKILSSSLKDILQNQINGKGDFAGNILLFFQHEEPDEDIAADISITLNNIDDNNSINYIGYPKVRRFNGQAYIDPKQLIIKAESSYMAGLNFDNVQFNMDLNTGKIGLKGETNGSFKQLGEFSRAFGKDLNLDELPKVQTAGDIYIDFDMDVVAYDPSPDVNYHLTIKLVDNQLVHTDYLDKPIELINGVLHLDNKGLESEAKFTARFADRDLTFSALATTIAGDHFLRFIASVPLPGEILNRLFALKQPLTTGTTHVDLLLDLHTDDFSFERLIVDTSFDGMDADVPLGVGKSKDEIVPSHFVLERTPDGLFMNIKVTDRIKGTVILKQNQPPIGWLGIGKASTKPIGVSEEQMQIVIDYETVQIEKLIDWFERKEFIEVIEQNQSQIDGTLLNNMPQLDTTQDFDISLLDTINLDFTANEIGASNFFVKNAKGSILKKEDTWVAELESDLLTTVIVFSSIGKLQKIEIDTLKIKEIMLPDDEKITKNEENYVDPLATFDPRISNPVELTINQLIYEDIYLGQWSMKVEPETQGLRLSQLEVTRGNIQALGSAFWQYSPDQPEGSQQHTKAELSIFGTNIETEIEHLFAEKVNISTKLEWDASPIGINKKNVVGDFDIDMVDGEIPTDNEILAIVNVIGLLNIETLGKRLSLDFSDQGDNISFDTITSELQIRDALVTTSEPFRLKGSSVSISLDGTTNLETEKVDHTLGIEIALGDSLPIATVLAGLAPQISVGLLVANYALKKPFSKLTSASFKIGGTTKYPEIVLKQLFYAGDDGKIDGIQNVPEENDEINHADKQKNNEN